MDEKGFKEELEVIINRYGVDAWIDMPDYILGEAVWNYIRELKRVFDDVAPSKADPVWAPGTTENPPGPDSDHARQPG